VAEDLLFIHDSMLSTWDFSPNMDDQEERLGYELSCKESDWWMERYPGW
jgi:hypothetical protein